MSIIGTSRRQSKAVTVAYALLAGLILLVIAALALVAVPPSPPSVSEFAPQAVDQIEDSPEQQSSQFGGGTGSCATGQVCEGQDAGQILAQKKVIERARVRRCVGDPPRQIEDPQSTPCVNYWQGDNGGATYKGVTRDEIRVATTSGSEVESSLVAFFNKRFEFYGRKIRLLSYSTQGNSSDPATMRGAAQKVDEELKAFASLPYSASIVSGGPFYDELSRRGILSVDNLASYRSEQNHFDRFRPFQWGFLPSLDKALQNEAQLICNSLVGEAAVFGGPDVQLSVRRFGVLVVKEAGDAPDSSWLQDGLARCGESMRVAEIVSGGNPNALSAAMLDFKTIGTTTLLCVCHGMYLYNQAMTAASDLNYFPEWLLSGIWGQDSDAFALAKPADTQRSHAFGVTTQNKMNPFQSMPWYWAYKEANPGASDASFSGSLAINAGNNHYLYTALLVLASGIQMAGPNLTPFTFEQGLFKAQFPNPSAGAAPYYQARVGFGPGNHTMVQDLGLIWFDQAGESYTTSPPRGSYCYVGRGSRYGLGQWPKGPQQFFDRTQPCK